MECVASAIAPRLLHHDKFGRFLFAAFFFLSGASSLIYQVVWQRLLGLHYGVSAMASAIIVGVFMLGLGLGSLAAGRYKLTRATAVRTYMIVEIAIAIFGLLSLPLLTIITEATAGSSYPLVAVFSFLFLLIPTLLMGATLPVALRALSPLSKGVLHDISTYYFANTLGAGVGALLTSFVLVSLVGLELTIYIAVALNLSLAFALFSLVPSAPGHGGASPPARAERPLPDRILYPAAFVGGFLAIGYEIVWFRLLGILLKDSIYSFAILLGLYLIFVAAGSYSVRWLVRCWISRRDLYLLLNGGVALAVASTVCLLFYAGEATIPGVLADIRGVMIMPIPPTDVAAIRPFALSLAASIGFATLLIGLPAFLMGASFPLVASLSGYDLDDPAGVVARVYFTVIVGNFAGALVTGFALLPLLGTERTLLLFIVLGLAFFVLRRGILSRLLPLAAALLLLGLFPARGELVRFLHDTSPGGTVRVLEGPEGSVVVQRTGPRLRLFINGSEHGGRPNPGFYLEGITALSSLDRPRHVLVIGVGTGSILEVALRDPSVTSVTLVEINGTVLRALKADPELAIILSHPKLRIVVDDARRWLHRSPERFDAILMDPLRSATGFSNNIYSEEFFRLQRAHLNEGGVAMIWTDELVSIPNTVARVYPQVRLYGDVFMVAAVGARPSVRPGRLRTLLNTFDADDRMAILDHEWARSKVVRTISFRADLPRNQDWMPRTEYYLGPAVAQLLNKTVRLPPWPKDLNMPSLAELADSQ